MTDCEEQLSRVRRISLSLPGASEKLSHGEPTFFVNKRVFVMFAGNHHGDGHIGVWIPVPEGHQSALIAALPDVYYRPPYVGTKSWVGIELDRLDDEQLREHIVEAWNIISKKR